MKKLVVILAAALLLSTFQPCLALTSDTYTSDTGTADGYIVKLKEPSANDVSLMASSDLSEISGEENLYHADTLSDVEKLGDDVLYYEPDYKVKLFDLPNDPYISKQWSVDFLGISSAWDAGYNGSGVKIAVIDSGVNSSHEDFAGTNIVTGTNIMDGTNNVADEMGHGTFVCGILSAQKNNGIGIAGFVPNATIIPIKCFGKSDETNASYIVDAIYTAVDDYNCDIINLSLGTDQNMKSLYDAVKHAASKGVIIVSAVGNEGNSTVIYPAAYDCVVGVGAVDRTGTVTSFSEKNNSVFVVAPGTSIESLDYKANNTYGAWSGTSFSTPFVSVAAAILKQYEPGATVNDFMQLLVNSSTDGGVPGYDTSYGYGTLNIASFIKTMQSSELRPIGVVFPDVAGHWAASSIDYCYKNGLFTGVSQTSFEPETLMNRAMFVTVLSRMSGENISGYQNSFTDVTDGTWYSQPCAWGADNGIVTGLGNSSFGPAGAVTREQMAVFLYRYALLYGLIDGSNNGVNTLSSFTDGSQVSTWATDAMAWAVENGLITGRSITVLAPQDSAKRCEVATIITRFIDAYGA